MEQTVINEKKHSGKALASMILGIVSLIFWLIPLFGAPLSIVGLILGIIGRNSDRKGKAKAGIIMNCIALVLTIGNVALGAYLLTHL